MDDGLYIGVDLGTTGVKIGLFRGDGSAVATAARELALDTPAPGFVELDAVRYTDLAMDAIRETLAAPGADRSKVRAVGLSSQAQTFVLLGGDGLPVRPAMSWLDVRAESEAEELSDLSERLTGRRISAIASGPKILWLRRHEPAAFARSRLLLLLPDYLIWRLTGRAVSDPLTAGSTGLWDRGRGEWTGGLLEACGLSRGMAPEVLRAGEAAGSLTAEAARRLGLREDVIVAVGTNDQSVGAIGAGNVTPGRASMTLGTALAVVFTTDACDRVPPGVIASPHPAGGGLWTMLTYAKTAGIVLRWFRDAFAPGASYGEVIAAAAAVPVGSGGVSCVPHFSGTATPSFNPSVRGAFAGISLGTTRAHMARAVLESLSFTVRENVELLVAASGGVGELRAGGGGARSDVWLQMIADATGVPVERPVTMEAACLGAAELAMVAAGRFDSIADASLALYRAQDRFAPDAAKRAAYDEAFARYEDLYRSLYGGCVSRCTEE